ncbi:hypothetical protein [Pseudonocardia sp. WMMC193]|uniref:hypothetical protein n=1 Tax=Pseudonocardia sp. WMMC193 TaxID=2911965 RepID=UPI001F3D6BBF|nr:hypothetical protein [Pseudonocardia sp. WMMC193]MCF7548678.1 hypothetical protein [Pseudonocardia sp. WMMC193]
MRTEPDRPTTSTRPPSIPVQRTASPETPTTSAAPAPDGGPEQAPCHCTHGASLHEHFRAGSDCAQCDCARYRAAPSPTANLAELLIGILRKGR